MNGEDFFRKHFRGYESNNSRRNAGGNHGSGRGVGRRGDGSGTAAASHVFEQRVIKPGLHLAIMRARVVFKHTRDKNQAARTVFETNWDAPVTIPLADFTSCRFDVDEVWEEYRLSGAST